MFLETFASVFITVFLAELGDKTQLATLTFSAENPNRLAVFLGSAGALTLAALIGVLVGSQLERFISPEKLKLVAGIGFIAIGIWTLWRG